MLSHCGLDIPCLSSIFGDPLVLPTVMKRRITGKLLAIRWGVDVRHALYHNQGVWYHHLKAFPAALFDAEGYAIFDSEEEYRACSELRFNQHCSCPEGISRIGGYQRFQDRVASDIGEAPMTERVTSKVSRIIRDTALARELKLIYDHQCQLCGTVVDLIDGRYSEAHHLRPLGSPHNGSDTKRNIVVVCPTCHVKLDYFSMPICAAHFKISFHEISQDSVDYHNTQHRLKMEPRSNSPRKDHGHQFA